MCCGRYIVLFHLLLLLIWMLWGVTVGGFVIVLVECLNVYVM
jgi:hypothetical protein